MGVPPLKIWALCLFIYLLKFSFCIKTPLLSPRSTRSETDRSRLVEQRSYSHSPYILHGHVTSKTSICLTRVSHPQDLKDSPTFSAAFLDIPKVISICKNSWFGPSYVDFLLERGWACSVISDEPLTTWERSFFVSAGVSAMLNDRAWNEMCTLRLQIHRAQNVFFESRCSIPVPVPGP